MDPSIEMCDEHLSCNSEDDDCSEEFRSWKIWVLVIVGAWYIVGFSNCFGWEQY